MVFQLICCHSNTAVEEQGKKREREIEREREREKRERERERERESECVGGCEREQEGLQVR